MSRAYAEQKKRDEEKQRANSTPSASSNVQKPGASNTGSYQHRRVSNDKSASNLRNAQQNRQNPVSNNRNSAQNNTQQIQPTNYRDKTSRHKVTNDKSMANFEKTRQESIAKRTSPDPWEPKPTDAYGRLQKVGRNAGEVAKESLKRVYYGDVIATNEDGAVSYSDDRRGVFDQKKYEESRAQNKARQQEYIQKRDESEQRTADITRGAKGLEKAIYDAVDSGTGMVADSAFGPLSLLHMGVRTAGSYRGKAMQEGATDEEDLWNSVMHGALEATTERFFRGIGVASKVTGGRGFSPASALANRLTRRMGGRSANAAQLAIRYGMGIGEENAEEILAALAENPMEEIAYRGAVRERKADDIHSQLVEQSNQFRSQITSPEQAEMASAYLSSPDFIEENIRMYKEAGIPVDQATQMAEAMRDYLAANLSGDVEKMADIESRLVNDIAGTRNLLPDLGEMRDTIAATTLLTGVTGLPGMVKTTDIGSRIKAELGDAKLRALANSAINFEDEEASMSAQAIKDRLDAGQEITASQAYELSEALEQQMAKNNEKEAAYFDTARRIISENNDNIPFRIDENGNTVMDEMTAKSYNVEKANAWDIVDNLDGEQVEGAEALSDEDLQKIVNAIAGFKTGVFTSNDIDVFGYTNTLARSAFKEATGIDLNKYTVYKKNGQIDYSKTNAKQSRALFALAADNLVESARVETANWIDTASGAALESVTKRMDGNGSAAVISALDNVDIRDKNAYMYNLTAADTMYSMARRMPLTWEQARDFSVSAFRGADEEMLHQMYEAGIRDREAVEDEARGIQTVIDQAISKGKESGTAYVNGKFTDERTDKSKPIKKSDMKIFQDIAQQLNINIAISDSIQGNGQYSPKTGKITLNAASTTEQNLGYIFMHETTHHLRLYAPEHWNKLVQLVKNRWSDVDPDRMNAEIDAKIELYKEKGNQILSRDQALEEIIADSAHEFLLDENFAKEVCAEDMGLAKSILNSIRRTLEKLRTVIANNYSDDTRMRSLFSELDILEEAERLWLNAYTEAYKNNMAVGLVEWNERNGEKLSASVRNSFSDNGTKSYRFVSSGENAISEYAGFAMFADNGESIEGAYGEDLYSVDNSSIPNINEFKEKIAEEWEASKELGIVPENLEEESGKSVADMFDPKDIIMSADAWDNTDLTTWAFDRGIFDDVPGIKTQDGAIVWDEGIINKEDSYGRDNVDFRFSITPEQDKTYMEAVESGDMETAQRMVDEAAKAAGYTVKAYHQTTGGFTVFDTSNPQAGRNDSETPNGIFFKTNDHDIGLEGKEQIPVYLNTGRTLRFKNREEANAWYRNHVKDYADLDKAKDEEVGELDKRMNELEDLMFGEGVTDEEYDRLNEEWDSMLGNMHTIEDGYRSRLRDLLNDYFINNGSEYDSIHLDYDGHRWVDGKREDVETYIVFKSNQAKLADPVTYDDDGNVIPLSERFNRSNPDIRYSVSDNVPMSELDKSGAVLEDANGEPVMQFDQDGSVRLSVTSYDAEGRKKYKAFLKNAVEKGDLTQEEADEMLREMETIFNICNNFADSGKYLPFTAWSEAEVLRDEKGRPIFSSVKKNSEYGMNMDFSTICKKRRTLDAVFNEMVKRGMFERMNLNMDESSELVVRINDIIREHGFEAACALCFVEARRYRQQQTATTFANMYNDLVKSLYKDESKISYFNYGRDDTAPNVENGIDTMDDSELDLSKVRKLANAKKNGKPLQTAEAKAARLILNDPSQRKLMRVGDMMSSVGFENFQVENPDLMKVYNSKKGTGGAKSSFGDVQYLNEIIRSKSFNRMKAYMVSGVRIQSFSDYVPRMVFDYVQMIGDLAAKKLPAHSYTKEVLFAMQFGLTGVKINLSLVPDVAENGIAPGLDKNGNYLWNADGTFPFEDFEDEKGKKWPGARTIQKAEGYKENCGTIAVGISDAQILKMLADPEIQMVIPYHKSSLNPLVAAMTNVDRFEDYTDYQNTKDENGKSLSGKKDFPWDRKLFRLTHDKDGNLLPKEKWGDPQDLVKEYASWCKKKGYTPKFERFLYLEDGKTINPGYYKLLEDFALYDNEGNFKPQGDVKMNFPTEESTFGSMASLIESGLEEDAVLEGQRTEDIENIVDEIEESAAAGTLVEGKRFSLPPEIAKNTDPSKLTEEQALNVLTRAKQGEFNKGTYIPVRATTPFLLIQLAAEKGLSYENLPMVMSVRKAMQAMEDETEEMIPNQPHGLDEDDIIEIMKAINDPSEVYYQANNHRLGVIVKLRGKRGKSTLCILSIEPNSISPDYLNGYEGGVYNVIITAFNPDKEYLKRYRENEDNEEIKKKGASQSGSGSILPSRLNDDPFFNESIASSQSESKGSFSITDTDSDGNPLTEDQSRTPNIRSSFSEDDIISQIAEEATDTEDIPREDAKDEEDRRRKAKSKQDFFAHMNAEWNERWLTEGKVLKKESVIRDIRQLVMGVMQNSDTSHQYKTDLVASTMKDARNAYKLMKEGKWSEAGDTLYESALYMLEDADFVDDSLFQQFKEVRDYLRHTEIFVGDEVKAEFEWDRFYKENRARMLLKNGDTNIDKVFMELAEMVPGEFNQDEVSNPADQLSAIADFVDRIQPYRQAYDSKTAADLAVSIAEDLFNIVYQQGESYQSVADTYKARYDELTKKMKAAHRDAIRKIREQENEKRRIQKEKFKAKEQETRQKAEHKLLYKSIQKNVKKLSDLIVKETDEKHVPEQFRNALAEMLTYFDLQKEGSKKWEEKHGTSKAAEKIRALRDEWAKIANENDTGSFEYDEEMFQRIDDVVKALEGKGSIDSLTNEEMDTIDDMLKAVLHQLRVYDSVLKENERVKIESIADPFIERMYDRIRKYGKRSERTGMIGALDRLVNEGEETPVYFFDRLGGGMQDMFYELRGGNDKHIRNMDYLRKRFQEICGGHENRLGRRKLPGSELEKWRSAGSLQKFDLAYGTIELTPAQIMSMYCLSQRQQAMNHMLKNGIVVAPVTFTASISEDIKSNIKGRKTDTKPIPLTEADINQIKTALTEDQKKMADDFMKLLNEEMSAWGNETSMELLGYEKFREKTYFPIKSASESLEKTAESHDVVEKIRSFSFTKGLTRGANNAIMVEDIFSVVADHCNKMSLYNSFAVPIRNFFKVYNYKRFDDEGRSTDLKQLIADAFGKGANNYILQFMDDLNGNTKTKSDPLEAVLNKTLANYKRASIGANVRVALQQPTAIMRAFMVLNPKYFMGIKVVSPAMVREMQEHCPIALWKSWGHYDVDMGRDIEEVMMNNDWSIGDTLSMGVYGALDNWTWTMIWQACKNEVKEKNPNVQEGTDEFWELCNKRASEVFDKTQVVDSIFHRSETMRSKNIMTKMMVSFMAEPTLTYNVLRDAAVNAREMRKDGDTAGASALAARAIVVFLLNTAAVSASAALWDVVRGKDPDSWLADLIGGDDDDDEEEKTWGELYIRNFFNNVSDNGNLLNNIYFVKDIWGLRDGFGTSNMALEGWELLWKGLNEIGAKIGLKEWSDLREGEKTWYEINQNFLGGIGYITGKPVKTLMKDLKPALDLVVDSAFAAEPGYQITLSDGSVITTTDYDEYVAAAEEHSNEIESSGYTEEAMSAFGTLVNYILHDKESAKRRKEAEKAKEEEEEEEKEEKGEDKKSEKKSSGTGTSDKKKKKSFAEMTDDEKIADLKEKYAGDSREEKTKKVWDKINDGYRDYIDKGDYDHIFQMRRIMASTGCDMNFYEEKILDASKKALKKSIIAGATDEQIRQQEEIRDYLVYHGVSQEELSEIAMKSDTVKDLKAAMRLNDHDAMVEELEPLVRAGLTYEDFERIWENRNNGRKTYKGKYHEREKQISTGVFNWPAQGVITSGFGYRRAPVRGASTYHQGIDIGGSIGDPIAASDGGTVTFAGWNGGYGYQVVVKHYDGSESLYSHLDSYSVQPGQIVSQGDQIARMGSTGTSSGPHLDFRIRVNGKFVNPMSYLNNGAVA